MLPTNELLQQTTNQQTNQSTYQLNNMQQTNTANKHFIKGLITGGLILLMLIPALLIQNLVIEREQRQKEVVKEVSSKWASQQTLSGPFITLPYTETSVGSDGKNVTITTQLIILANNMQVNGSMQPEVRPRSIYKVLLYKSAIQFAGDFLPTWPANINTDNIDFANAKLCFTLTDFKGIEEELTATFNGEKIALNPGLPVTDFGEVGVSAAISVSKQNFENGINFSLPIKIKGSEQLHFLPLSGNSKFVINSTWANPSFDGNVLPNSRSVKGSGFAAQWNFNRANLPFAMVFKEHAFKISNIAFGVSLVQPADQYNKTSRSVKYAILIIGLSFGLFFIIELLQSKAFHPVQYVLVGLALVIFYTLLLSISEYILFNTAYLIAAAATVLLICMYAYSHFKSFATTGVFAFVLSALYGFVFVLISLEDTALLIGSIGLFIILAMVMFASRKINWYANSTPQNI